ncbi:ketopantoate reductase family protein [Mycobacterium intracellulare]|uniref:2-dehydropantoate 2-reductase n=1 Tax=Mycobacterium intracellulare subsp. chimaera TaxID=222805 RepID=A0A7U5MPP1_MYCIT|nr:2-dehydropantoate 2-reductase [Mycobacterium intracellulare]ASL17442.1 2-dehydropantoate 2-reductase [Mycobacterium intracellulare subsp. chimaera]ASQ88387.1 2-dehydropantoate 2-reductase [Mycobacterium intracellulare subsp. chimaera]MCF1815188.1 2-dehydropantoate 2-reductase [Mycobacterium intracellulare subsp. intracellulare]MDM3926875.1 2-dehydropantoate 2-reductase [Mycobacterium intracellulare subsp. chimaera]MDS0337124.1 2-dehydropantoate 2-reductase [Mycobacterium intracellulare]
MKIAVIGCGAMGSIYAARLATAGNDVLAIDRHEPSVERISRDGLRVTGPAYDRVVPLRASTTAPDEPMDLIVLAIKAADVTVGARQALPMLGPATPVLTIQNGLGSAETVAGIVGAERVAVGIASGFGASRVAPGHVHHNAMRAMRFGAHSSLPHATVETIARAWTDAGFDAAAVTDIAAMQWEKLICNAAYSAPCALTGMTVGQVMDDPEMAPVSRAAATEAWTVARASGIAVAVTDPVAHARDFGAQMPDAKPSALLDHEARRVSEIDVINGAVPRQGARVGVAAPVNATLTALIKAIERQWG